MPLGSNILLTYWLRSQNAPAPEIPDIPYDYARRGALRAINNTYLDTGLLTDASDEWILKIGKETKDSWSSGHIAGGSQTGTDSNVGLYTGGGNDGNRIAASFGNAVSGNASLECLDISIAEPHEIRFKIVTGELWVDGVYYGQVAVTSTVPHPNKILLFAESRGSGIASYFRSGYVDLFTIIRNGVVVRDYVAVTELIGDMRSGYVDRQAVRNGIGQVFYPWQADGMDTYDITCSVEVTEDNKTWTLAANSATSGSYITKSSIAWGDGTTTNIQNESTDSHTYTSTGIYQVHVEANYVSNGKLLLTNNTSSASTANSAMLKDITSFSGQIVPAYMANYAINMNCNPSVFGDVRYIREFAFRCCSLLSWTTCPPNLVRIERSAFAGCTSLAMSNVSTHLKYIGQAAFSDTGVTISSLPDGLTYIGDSAFSNCTSLRLRAIPASVAYIGSYAFKSCSNMPLMSLQGPVTAIGGSTFDGCTALALTQLPDTITTIGSYAFRNCSSMRLSALPANLTTIGQWAFAGCANLQITTIPGNVSSIDTGAFSGCTSLPLASIQGSLQLINADTFDGCTALALTQLPNTVTAINSRAFRGCSNMQLASLPTSLVTIGQEAFRGCSNMQLASLPTSLVTIGQEAFRGCSKITISNIPEGVTTINNNAFLDCNGITSLTVASTVLTIGFQSFGYCKGLTTVVFNGTPTTLNSGAFASDSAITDIYVPWSSGDVAGAPWGASNATIHYNYTP